MPHLHPLTASPRRNKKRWVKKWRSSITSTGLVTNILPPSSFITIKSLRRPLGVFKKIYRLTTTGKLKIIREVIRLRS